MRAILEIRCRCKGAFALRRGLKVEKGTLCSLNRDPPNAHGQLRKCIFVNAPQDGSTWRHWRILEWYLIFSYLSSVTDANCIQILAPIDSAPTPPSTYVLGERVGNVSREVSLVLASLMDFENINLPESNAYDLGFRFQCELEEISHHKAEGYCVKIIVYSINSDIFTDIMYDILDSKGLNPLRMIKMWYNLFLLKWLCFSRTLIKFW